MGGCKYAKNSQNFEHHAYLQPQNLDIIVRGICEDTLVNILVDTGASASLVSTRLIDQLNLIDQIRPTLIKITGLSNKIIPMRGEI